MEEWWSGNGKRMPMQLSDYGKSEMQEITGQLLILLSALYRINLDFPGGGEIPEADIYASKLMIYGIVRKSSQ